MSYHPLVLQSYMSMPCFTISLVFQFIPDKNLLVNYKHQITSYIIIYNKTFVQLSVLYIQGLCLSASIKGKKLKTANHNALLCPRSHHYCLQYTHTCRNA